MKTCPFCKEDIKDDAIKCRYCQSLLLPLQPELPSQNNKETRYAEEDGRTATYILDKDLIRFGKFGFFLLGLFTIVGVYLYGVDLKDVSKDQEVTKDKLEALKKHLDNQANDIKKTSEELRSQREQYDKSNKAFLTMQENFKRHNAELAQTLVSTTLIVTENSKKSGDYLNNSKIIYGLLKNYKTKGDSLIQLLVGKIQDAQGTPVQRLIDSSISLTIGAQITSSEDPSTFGVIAYYLKDQQGSYYAVCSSPIFPSPGIVKDVLVISTNRSTLPIGVSFKQSSTAPVVGIIKLANAHPENINPPFGDITSFADVGSHDIGQAVFLSNQGSRKEGRIVSVNNASNFLTPSGQVFFKNLFVASIEVKAGMSGSLLVNGNNEAIGILIGGNDRFSYFAPISQIIKEFNLKPIK